MSIRPIVKLGHPALRTPARPLARDQVATADVQALIDDMVETMRAARGVGLAAPQVGEELQLFVYLVPAPVPEQSPDPLEIPLQVVINPMLTPQAGELVYDWEGCLSIPDLRGLVPRHPAVRVQGLDREGGTLDYVASGFPARIVQHECDHLNGVIFLDRMRDLRSLAYADEWDRFVAAGGAHAEETALG
jgi:peptide deformylase